MLGRRSAESGRLGGSFARRTKGLVGVAALALASGGLYGLQNRTEEGLSIDGGTATLEAVWSMPGKECHGGYEVMVEGAVAEAEVALDLGVISSIPGVSTVTTYKASETMNGLVTNEICNAESPELLEQQLIIEDGPDGRKLTLNVEADAFTSTVYLTDPTDPGLFTSDNNFVAGVHDAFANVVKSLPGGLDVEGPDRISSQLRGYAMLGAFDTSSRGCGQLAWGLLRPLYAHELQIAVAADNNAFDPDIPVDPEDVTVNLPSEVTFTNQYTDQFKEIRGEIEAGGVNVSYPSAESLSENCKAAPDVQVEQRGGADNGGSRATTEPQPTQGA